MQESEFFRVKLTSGMAYPQPPANDNDHLKPDWMTPAELMQWLRDERKRLSREVAADASLWHCPKHRREWDITLGMEKVTLRVCYGIMEA